jgi:Mg2+ and Co2+ transporter CorA
MRIFTISATQVTESSDLDALAGAGPPLMSYLWIACTRLEFESRQAQFQGALQSLCGVQLVDLHISDLLNTQLPSHYDYTSQYDVLVFRRLAAGNAESDTQQTGLPPRLLPARGGPPVLRRIDTNPVGFALFDQVLLSVHPADCAVRDAYADKLLDWVIADTRASGTRLPGTPADLMLRIVNQMVDGYLGLRRQLTHQLDHWQTELINPRTRFNNWAALLEARLALHHLDEICEDQRSAMQDWIEALKTWPEANTPSARRDHDLLQVRSRDVLEHIERVVHHVRRLEQSAETAVQMHFSAQSHRTNEIMRTLTVLTAIFLPLNLIAGIFGMNFEFIPLLHRSNGFWLAMSLMALTAVGLVVFFWRKRYLERSAR